MYREGRDKTHVPISFGSLFEILRVLSICVPRPEGFRN